MKIKYSNMFFDIKIQNTNDNLGLKEDTWCNVSIVLNNEMFHYEISKNILSKKEIIKMIDTTKKYYNLKYPNGLKLNHIKNYLIIKFNPIKENKKIIEMILIDQNKKNYCIFFENEEIKEFIKLLESFKI